MSEPSRSPSRSSPSPSDGAGRRWSASPPPWWSPRRPVFSNLLTGSWKQLPLVGHSYWVRGLIPLAFCLAMLAAIGLDAVLRQSERRRAARWGLGAFGAIAVLLGLIWLFGRGSLPPHEAHVRADSFVWPVVSTVVGLAAFGTLVVIDRRPTGKEWSREGLRGLALGAAGVLLVCQTVFLVVLDAPLPSSSSTPYQPTPGVTALQRAVGSSLVGLGDGLAGVRWLESRVVSGLQRFLRNSRIRRIRPHCTVDATSPSGPRRTEPLQD